MVTDNFEQIVNILRSRDTTPDEDRFYFLQIVKRKKDNPELESHRHLIDSWYIKTADQLLEKRDRIIEQCEVNNARAYFRLNRRSFQKVAVQTLALIAQNIAANNYDIKNCYEKCAGLYHSDEDKTWVIDVDHDKDETGKELVSSVLWDVQELVRETGKSPDCYLIPTKNGSHIISRPFNAMKFKQKWPTIDYHKDNPTILYIP